MQQSRDADETLFDAMRPAILNGIEDAVTRPDLADRALFLTLQAIPEEARKPEAELRAAFDTARPRILGALLDGVAEGLRRLPEVRLERLPRMADFALWATACETAFWPAGTFESVFDAARQEAVASVIEADAVASAVRALAEVRTQWTGTATNLLGALAEEAGEAATRDKGWPKTARALSGRLRRAATFLRKLGVAVDFDRDGPGRTRLVHITFTARENEAAFASRPSRPSAPEGNPAETMAWPDGFADGRRTQTATADANAPGLDASPLSTVRANPSELRDMDAKDGMDAKPRSLAGGAENAAPGWQARL